jgi:NhaA family Na+:H+ antiporter
VKAGKARLPDGTTWIHIYGVSLIAGIGFTMSLFIGMLAFPDTALHDQVKLGVLVGSLLSAVLGWAVLRFSKTP